MIIDIRKKYLNKNTCDEWENLINEASELLYDEDMFNKEIHPYFYSGNLFKAFPNEINPIKYLFITMNPKKRKDRNYPDDNIGLNEKDYLLKQNKNFDIFTSGSDIFNKCYNVVMRLENIQNKGINYSLLEKKAVIVDWFPFYSENFQLYKPSNLLALDLLYPILKLLNDNQIIGFALNRAIKSAIKKLSNTFNIQDMKKISEIKSLKLQELRFHNIEVYKINMSILVVLPILAKHSEPNTNLYNEIATIIYEIAKIKIF